MIRPVIESDAKEIAEIYNYYILNTIATFQEDKVSESDIKDKINQVIRSYPWFVFEENNKVIGYAYANQWKERTAYRFCVESSIYVKDEYQKKGVGSQLLSYLISDLKEDDFHSVIAGIAFPNEASVAMYKKNGFRKVAHFTDIGYKFEQWIDLEYWELLLKNIQ